jgi:outer membrane protein assembly factor BamB
MQQLVKNLIPIIIAILVLALISCGGSVKPEVAWPKSEEELVKGEYGPVAGPDGTLYITKEDGVYAVSQDGNLKISTQETGAFDDDVRFVEANLAVGEDGTVYVSTGGHGGLLAALSPDLELLWTFTIRSYLDGEDPSKVATDSPYVKIYNLSLSEGETIYLGTKDISDKDGYYQKTGFVIAVNSDGSVKWDSMLPFADVVSGPLVASNGTIMIGISDPLDYSFGQVIALDPEDGTELWYADVEPNPLLALGPDGRVYNGGGYGTVYAFTSEGETIWELRLDDNINISEVSTPVVAADGTVYCVAGDLYSISSEGEIVWEIDSDSDNQVLIAGKDLLYTYSTRGPGPLTAFNAEGDKLWQFPEENEEESSSERGFAFVDTPVFGEESGLIGLIEGFYDNALAHITTGTKGPALEASWPKPGRNNRNTAAHDLIPGALVPERVGKTPVTENESVIPGGTARGNLARTGEYPGSLGAGSQQIVWDIENKLLSAAAVTGDDEKVYYGGIRRWTGFVTAVDQNTGEEVWQFKASAASPISVTQSAVFFGVYEHYLIALDKSDGALLWKYPAGGAVLTSPVVSEGKVVFIGEDGILRTVNAVTGKLLWEKKIPEYIGDSSPALSDGTIFIQTNPRQVAAFDFKTGQEKWIYTVDEKINDQYWSEKMVAAAESKVFGISGGYAFALDAVTGEELWLNEISASGSPLCTGGSLFITSASGRVLVVDPDEGTEIGRIEIPGGGFEITSGDKIIFVSSNSGVFGFRKADGSRVFNKAWSGKRIEPKSEVSIIGDRAYVMSRSNRTYNTNHTYSLGTE